MQSISRIRSTAVPFSPRRMASEAADALAHVPCFGMELLERRLLYAAGDLDVSFDHDGWTSYAGIYRVTDMLVEDDGRTVVVGDDNEYFQRIVLTRFRADGLLDPAFGNGGTVVTDAFFEQREFVHGMARQADGKYLVCGYILTLGEGNDVVVLRYNADGSLDTTFGDGGVAKPAVGFHSRARQVSVGADGTITVAGGRGEVPEQDLLLARLTSDGALDTTFGNGGVITADFGYSDEILDFTIRPDGSTIMLVRSAGKGIATVFVMRLTADGAVDETFGVGGRAAVSAAHGYEFTRVEQLIVLDDGRYLVGGRVHNGYNIVGMLEPRLAVARYNADGSADASFGDGGAVVITGDDRVIDHGQMAVGPDGSIVLAGFLDSQVDGDWGMGNFAIALLDADGHARADFGDGGVMISDLPNYNLPGRVAFAADGKIVLLGTVSYATLIVARYDGQAPAAPEAEAPLLGFAPGGNRFFALDDETDAARSAFSLLGESSSDLIDGESDEDDLLVDPTAP